MTNNPKYEVETEVKPGRMLLTVTEKSTKKIGKVKIDKSQTVALASGTSQSMFDFAKILARSYESKVISGTSPKEAIQQVASSV